MRERCVCELFLPSLCSYFKSRKIYAVTVQFLSYIIDKSQDSIDNESLGVVQTFQF